MDLPYAFHNNCTFTVVTNVLNQGTGEISAVENEINSYPVAGEIILNRDNSVEVYLYRYTETELLERDNAQLLMELLLNTR